MRMRKTGGQRCGLHVLALIVIGLSCLTLPVVAEQTKDGEEAGAAERTCL